MSDNLAQFGKGPASFLMTREELAQWRSVATDADAQSFIDLFWARRDPTPATPRNEFREDFDARVIVADSNFSTKTVRGSMSDRGRILIVFGAPSRAVRTGGTGHVDVTSPGSTFSSRNTDTEAEDTKEVERSMWTYESEVAQRMFSAPRIELRFSDRRRDRNERLETPLIDLKAAQARVVNAAITQPNLTKVPTYQTTSSTTTTTTTTTTSAVAPATPTTLTTATLETAITDAKAGQVPTKDATVTYAEFVSPAGDYYIPAGLYVPPSAALAADAADAFFGVVDDASGKRVQAFEEPAKPTTSKNAQFFAHTLTLPAGTYTLTLGIAKAGAPVAIASTPVTTSPVAKDVVGTSKLVLSDIIETIEAAPVKTAFAFGKLRIVPRSAFTNKDELGYFVEVHNPGIDPTTNLPKLQAKLELVQPSGPPITAPLSDVPALPLLGAVGPGEYAVISGIPMGQMKNPLKPGDYTLRVKLVDTVSKKSYTVEQKFKIVG
ncbi:MAG TPA: GWxTD domain-containing protein [Thermoanaerobaculia bacterium]|nr:GWxTD domain-containing protein [Thermoanaerobaculia bacterium]